MQVEEIRQVEVEKIRIKVNIDKSSIMTVNEQGGQHYNLTEKVETYKYLKSIITKN